MAFGDDSGNAIIVSRSLAARLLGKTDPLARTVVMPGGTSYL